MATSIETARPEPTPDHPPYSWMIGEAIDALPGSSASEEVISAFILGRHPGVHDRLLRHYLAKHVADGLFVCRTAEGLYSRPGSHGAQVTVAKLSPDHGRQQPPELALVVANNDEDGDGPTMDHDQTCTMAPTAADGTNYMSSGRRPCNEAPVHSPATTSDANIKKKKRKPIDHRGRQRQCKVQELYDRDEPKRVLPARNVQAGDNQMSYVLALPAPGKR